MTSAEINAVLEQIGSKPKSLLEIGSFWGDTAIAFAKELNIPVVCVDTWLGGLAVWKDTAPTGFLMHDLNRTLFAKVMRRLSRSNRWFRKEIPPAQKFFRQFASNVFSSGAVDKITSIRLPSPTAMRLLLARGLRFDAIYVDASHDYMDVFMDIALARALTTEEGFVFGDDFQSPDVRDAVFDYCTENNLEFGTLPTIRSDGGAKRSYWFIRPTDHVKKA